MGAYPLAASSGLAPGASVTPTPRAALAAKYAITPEVGRSGLTITMPAPAAVLKCDPAEFRVWKPFDTLPGCVLPPAVQASCT